MSDKRLYILAGCNGAGKTTAAYALLPEQLDCKEFVNADEIARGLSPFNPERVSIQAGKLMVHQTQIKKCITKANQKADDLQNAMKGDHSII